MSCFSGDGMRLISLTVSTGLSAVLLSGCSFIGGPSSPFKNPFAKQKAANHAQYGAPNRQMGAQRCQIQAPTQPIPQGCRPDQVTLGVGQQAQYGQSQYGHGHQTQGQYGGFSQEPQFGQPQYASGGYGAAVGQSQAVAHHTTGPKKRKPKLRGSLSLGLERSLAGSLIDYGIRDDIDPRANYNPQIYNEFFTTGSEADGSITDVTYTANELDAANIYAANTYESDSRPGISFDDAWATPAQIKAGLEYIINDRTTVFANGGYSLAEGNSGDAASVTATIYEETVVTNYTPRLDALGEEIPGQFVEDGVPSVNLGFNPNQQIATFAYDFSDLERYDLEVGARYYFDPIVKSQGYRTVTPFVGASVGASHVNAVDVSVSQTQTYYERAFNGETEDTTYSVPTGANSTRLYDAQWLPQGQLNVGAEWQVTPGFALAAESGVRLQSARKYSDFTNTAGETVEGRKGDMNISIPLTLRGSVNF